MINTNTHITIVTPVYNRANKLSDLYNSLLAQTNKDFIWLIIDDGSTDDINEKVTNWINENKILIRFERKVNGGKHTALNYSYRFITTPLTFIVDSDDTIVDNAISLIDEKYDRYKNEEDLCGFCFLKGYPSGKYLNTGHLPKYDTKESFIECRLNHKIGGDMAEVWFTHCLKEYPFPEFEGEKFLSEDVVWIKIAEKYKLRFYNELIYIADYFDDGLTKNRRRHNINSPRGCVLRAEIFLNSNVILSHKIKAMLQYIIYGKFAGYKQSKMFKKTREKLLYIILYIPAMLLYFNWKKYKK